MLRASDLEFDQGALLVLLDPGGCKISNYSLDRNIPYRFVVDSVRKHTGGILSPADLDELFVCNCQLM